MAAIPVINVENNQISHSDDWNSNIINTVKVTGEKRIPSPSRMLLQKAFAVSPNSVRTKENIQKVQEVNTLSKVSWNEDSSKSDIDTDEQQMLITFEEPLLIGSGNYKVLVGDINNIGITGTINHDNQDRIAFVEVQNPGLTGDYFVMLSNRYEFRVCTAEDYDDMVDDEGNWKVYSGTDSIGTGTPPLDKNDIKTDSHFYIKQMNGAYGRNNAKYLTYKTTLQSYYLDENGIAKPGSKEPNEPGQNFYTSSVNKIADIIVKPVDLSENPLFPYHGVSGKEGYHSDYASILDESFAMQIQKVQVTAETVDVKYANWGEQSQYFKFQLSGYPLSVVESVVHEIEPTTEQIRTFGRKSASIDSRFISKSRQCAFVANMIRFTHSEDTEERSSKMMFSPHLEIYDLAMLAGKNESVFVETKDLVDTLSDTGATTEVKGNEEGINIANKDFKTFDNTFDQSFK